MYGSDDDAPVIGTDAERRLLLNDTDDECVLTDAQRGSNGTSAPGITAIRSQVDAVTGVMRDNVDRIVRRDAALNDLDARSNALADSSQDFYLASSRVRRRMWYHNVRIVAGLGVLFILVLIIIVILARPHSTKK